MYLHSATSVDGRDRERLEEPLPDLAVGVDQVAPHEADSSRRSSANSTG